MIKPIVYVDKQEKNVMILERLMVYGEERGVDIKVKDWTGSGDYIIVDKDGHKWGIEYKSFDDCYHSIIQKDKDGNGRIYGQLAQLIKDYDGRAILMLGTYEHNPVKVRKSPWLVKRVVYSFFSRRSLVMPTWILSGPDHIAKFMVETALIFNDIEFQARNIKIKLRK